MVGPACAEDEDVEGLGGGGWGGHCEVWRVGWKVGRMVGYRGYFGKGLSADFVFRRRYCILLMNANIEKVASCVLLLLVRSKLMLG